MKKDIRIALTGFMGVGKSSVSRHLAGMLKIKRIDLDTFIEENEKRKIAQIIDTDGVERYRGIETDNLKKLLASNDARILSLGGGTWTIPENRELLKSHNFTTVWLESTFEHCWLNIAFSRKDRPLARDKKKALELFEERQKVYCLADWHFVIRPGNTSYDVAREIADEIFHETAFRCCETSKFHFIILVLNKFAFCPEVLGRSLLSIAIIWLRLYSNNRSDVFGGKDEN